MSKRRLPLFIALILIVLIVVLVNLGLWNAKGNLIDLVRGQMPAE